jgi:uncharacterized membrane protein
VEVYMTPVVLTDFWEIMGSIVIAFFAFMVILMFISVFVDIFTRRNLSGWAKAGWVVLIFVLPFIGVLAYLIFRPSTTVEDVSWARMRPAGESAAEEIAKASELLRAGAIDETEFETIKRRALA